MTQKMGACDNCTSFSRAIIGGWRRRADFDWPTRRAQHKLAESAFVAPRKNVLSRSDRRRLFWRLFAAANQKTKCNPLDDPLVGTILEFS